MRTKEKYEKMKLKERKEKGEADEEKMEKKVNRAVGFERKGESEKSKKEI